MDIPHAVQQCLDRQGITELRPGQLAATQNGLFTGDNLLVTTPTASGKTLIAEMAFLSHILSGEGKAIYIVPLKALAQEKYRSFKEKYGSLFRITIAIGDLDSPDPSLGRNDLIICTSEKLDSLMRHHVPWIKQVSCLILDEIHLLNDPGRGPTLEILITMLRRILSPQIIGLSATIGNADELAQWLNAYLVEDTWRPVDLYKGIYLNGEVEFFKE